MRILGRDLSIKLPFLKTIIQALLRYNSSVWSSNIFAGDNLIYKERSRGGCTTSIFPRIQPPLNLICIPFKTDLHYDRASLNNNSRVHHFSYYLSGNLTMHLQNDISVNNANSSADILQLSSHWSRIKLTSPTSNSTFSSPEKQSFLYISGHYLHDTHPP